MHPSTYQREVIHDPACGEITVDHDPSSGAIFIEFERFETNDGVVIPLFRVSLTMEHVALWIEHILTHECGRRCRRIGWDSGGRKRLQAILKHTEADASLVYCAHHGPHVILVRAGRVVKVPLCLTYTMGDLRGVIKEEVGRDPPTRPSIQSFAEFVRGLLN
jgi:hypothetical protein